MAFVLARGAKERAGEMQERYTFLASLYEVMEGNGVAITDDTRTAANMIVKVSKSSLLLRKTNVFRHTGCRKWVFD